MREVFSMLQDCLEKGDACEMVTVIASDGSVPREAGSRMLVFADGSICGTIGGGAVEYRSMQLAGKAIEEKRSFVQEFELKNNLEPGDRDVIKLGMVCGGDVTVCFQYMDPKNEGLKQLSAAFCQARSQNEDAWLILDTTAGGDFAMGLYNKTAGSVGLAPPETVLEALNVDKIVHTEADGHTYYLEPFVKAGLVYVFGGGHVAQELVPLLSRVDFRCVVMDDREEFANKRVFPDAVKTIAGDMECISQYMEIGAKDYVCVMTRGHHYDYLVQKQVLSLKPFYIGVIGSRNKIKFVTNKLLADGFSQEEIDRCHTPIGIDIKAVTPAEIAVSVAGELIRVRASQRKDTGNKTCPS